MEEFRQEIIDNIKHEQEVHFTCYLPDDPETEDEPEVKEVKIVLRKFDKKWKSPAELFESYFACGKCEYATRNSGNLCNHLKTCKILEKCGDYGFKSKSIKIIECVFCYQQFKNNNSKSIHISEVHCKDSSWHCSKCDYKTSTKRCLGYHYQSHVKKFSCSTCKQNFSQKQHLKNHQQQHRHGDYATGPETKYECTICIRSFATKPGLRNHERNFHSKLNFHCDVCGRTKKTKPELRIHMQTHQKVPCPICHHLLAKRRLQTHIEKHSTTARFKCDDCGNVYFNLSALSNHKNRKHEIEPVQCDFCNKVFKNKLLLRHHMRIHLMVSCSTCSRMISKTSLNRHMKIHESRRESLACGIAYCHQKFSSLKEFEDHKRIHIGPQNYKCPNCNYHTKTLQQVTSHMKHHQA